MKREGFFCDNCDKVMEPKEIFFGLTSTDEMLIGTCRNKIFTVEKQVGIHFCNEKCLLDFINTKSIEELKEKTEELK